MHDLEHSPGRSPASERAVGGMPRHQAVRPAGTCRALAYIVLAVMLVANAAMAQPRVDATSITVQSATVLGYLEANASNTTGMSCFRQGKAPDRSYNCLLQAVRGADLESTFSGPGPITIFAPTDSAFARLSGLLGDKAFSALMRDPARLKAMIEAALLPRVMTGPDLSQRASSATGRAALSTVDGGELTIAFGRFEPRNLTSIAIGRGRTPKWQAYVSDSSVLLNNGSLVPISMVILPPDILAD